MKYDPYIHHRRSIRLREHDYSANGAYFVTICTQGRECLFGEIVKGSLGLNDAGKMIKHWWNKLSTKFQTVETDESIIMPNHFHGIVCIVGAAPCGRPPFPMCPPLPVCGNQDTTSKPGHPHGGAPTMGDVIDWFKTMTTNAYIRGVQQSGWPPFQGRLWQRNYYERVIRDERELAGIREYIRYNPMKWGQDGENPVNGACSADRRGGVSPP